MLKVPRTSHFTQVGAREGLCCLRKVSIFELLSCATGGLGWRLLLSLNILAHKIGLSIVCCCNWYLYI